MESIVDRAVAGARFNTVLLGIFAVIAFVLASVGIYGVIACDVTERTHEIGIRVALGAQPGDVLKLVVGQGARLAACGIALGLAGGLRAHPADGLDALQRQGHGRYHVRRRSPCCWEAWRWRRVTCLRGAPWRSIPWWPYGMNRTKGRMNRKNNDHTSQCREVL